VIHSLPERTAAWAAGARGRGTPARSGGEIRAPRRSTRVRATVPARVSRRRPRRDGESDPRRVSLSRWTAGLTALLLTLAATAGAAGAGPAPRIIVLAPTADDRISPRLQAELRALHFDVPEVEIAPDPPSRAQLEDAARQSEAVAAVRIVPSRTPVRRRERAPQRGVRRHRGPLTRLTRGRPTPLLRRADRRTARSPSVAR
jgi:hypothetical protein